ncbi:hypothetical protein EX30DRAFT_392295 [Ascodesmis nigricans]|uniref:HTH CENPB-type domain-containing protein n=1 Tax=Ascodesmis nigricans TaxID=341454 RepID=A0A4S2N6D9_9PEZI|nr:hypothetical protein EX30DRAFT_392295 [Ascodesmis nigricans]
MEKEVTKLNLEQRMQKALHELGENPNANIKHTAAVNLLNRNALSNRFRGKTHAAHQAHENQQRLSPSQELVIVAWIQERAAMGLMTSSHEVRERAYEIMRSTGDAKPHLHDHWVGEFLERQTVLNDAAINGKMRRWGNIKSESCDCR